MHRIAGMSLLLLAVVIVCVGAGLQLARSRTAGVEASATNEMVIDADPSTAAIESMRPVSNSSPFSIEVSVASDVDAYRAYQMELSWPDAGLDLMGTTTPAPSSPLPVCQNTAFHYSSGGIETLQDSCETGHGTTTYVGPLESVDFMCAALGTYTIHLVPLSEDPNFGSTLLASSAAPLPTGTTDATIVCTEGTATPTPTGTPCPTACPTTTPIATPTATSTPCSQSCGLAIDADPSTAFIDANRTVSVSSLFSIGIDVTDAVQYQGYQVEVSWNDSGLDFHHTTPTSYSPFQSCQAPNQVFNGGIEIVQDSCSKTQQPVSYIGQVETISLVCTSAGTFPLHLITITEDPAFGSTLVNHFGVSIPTQTLDATIVCADPTVTPTATASPTATATATPTSTAAPITVGGVADVHIGGGASSASAGASADTSHRDRATTVTLALAGALSIAACSWYVRQRSRRRR